MASPPSKHAARGEWISYCQFHDLEDSHVLDAVVDRVLASRGGEAPSLVYLDLDSTLYEVAPRTVHILREALEHLEGHVPPHISQSVAELLSRGQVGYSVRDTVLSTGIAADRVVEDAIETFRSYWWDRFFSNEYLTHDKPYPGAVEFVDRLHKAGAEVVYLTGRDEPRMGPGTRRNLKRDGFPIDTERTTLILKHNHKLEDSAFKADAAKRLGSKGKPVASFENEPKNLVAMYEVIPEAMHVFVDTLCSDNPASVVQGLYRIRGFSR